MTGNNEKLRGMWEKEMYAHKKRHTVKFSLFHTHTIGVETLKKVHPLPHTIIPEPHIYVHIYIHTAELSRRCTLIHTYIHAYIYVCMHICIYRLGTH